MSLIETAAQIARKLGVKVIKYEDISLPSLKRGSTSAELTHIGHVTADPYAPDVQIPHGKIGNGKVKVPPPYDGDTSRFG